MWPSQTAISRLDLGHSHWSVRYGAAALLAALALGLNLLPPARSLPFLFFFAAVTLSARICGFGAALFTTLLSAAAAYFFIMQPGFSFAHSRADLLRLLFFSLVALLISSIAKKKSEAEKLAEERRTELAAIVECSEDVIFKKTLDGTISSWNKAAERLYGYTPEEIIGRNVAVLAPPEKAAEIAGILRQLNRGERIAHFETERVTKKGKRIDVSLSISPVFDAEGKIVAAATIARDITERKRAEAALRRSDERFRAAHAMAKVSAFDWDISGGNVAWFTQLASLRGLAPDGKFESWMNLVYPEDKPKIEAAIQRLFNEGGAELEVRLVRPDGDVVWLSERGELYTDDNGEQHCLGVAMDVTERKRTDEILRRAEKLATAGELGATIAHEMNNPLAAVTNLAYLIRKNKSLDEKARNQLELLDQELARMAHMTRRTLGFYRDTSSPVSADMSEIMDEALELYARRIESKAIKVQKDYQAHAEVAVFPGEIRKVFSNLIANSIDAIGSRGTITIRVRNSHRWNDSALRGARITVADSGTGIKPADKHKIFEPFYTTKKETGTGLGLWLSKDIVQKHGGSISVRSKPNGTAFSVFIPAKSIPISKNVDEERQTA